MIELDPKVTIFRGCGGRISWTIGGIVAGHAEKEWEIFKFEMF